MLNVEHLLTSMMYADLLFVPCEKNKTVNKNLIGTGYMSADQKKKLLWGNKKNTAAEEVIMNYSSMSFCSCFFLI